MYVYDAQIMVWERSYSSVEMKVKKWLRTPTTLYLF
jgi:hypothetical protein